MHAKHATRAVRLALIYLSAAVVALGVFAGAQLERA